MVDAVVSAAVGLMLLAIAAAALPSTWGWRSYVVLSGSMEPAITLGSLVIARPVELAQLQVGDVISFSRREAPGVVITHRLVARVERGDQLQLVTKGDANNAADAWNVSSGDRVERVQYHVPYAGYLVSYAARPQARAAFFLVVLGYVAVQVTMRLASRAKAQGNGGK